MADYIGKYSGVDIDRLLDYVSILERSEPLGIQVDTTNPDAKLQRIDISGNNLNVSSKFFNAHVLWDLKTCVRNYTTGAISYGTNNRGDGLSLDGSMGDVLIEYAPGNVWFNIDGDFLQYFVAPNTSFDSRFSRHPAALQRGGSFHPKIYLSAYEPTLRDTNGTLKFTSISGAQPWTGKSFKSLTFTNGGTAFTKGEILTGATSGATGIVIDFHLTSGSWGGTAAGIVYIKQSTGTFQAESIAGSVSGTATSSGSATELALKLSDAETYAQNIGTGFGVQNIWNWKYIQLLMYIEAGTRNIQSIYGKGVVDLPQGTGYAGVLTGADNIDVNLDEFGTGKGSGIDGRTPVCWRGIRNFYGNVWKYVIGLNFMQSTSSYRVTKRDGTGALSAILADGSYETGNGIPLTTGYTSTILTDGLSSILFMPSAVAGSNVTYYCDKYTAPVADSAVGVYGGGWYMDGGSAGPERIDASVASNNSWYTSGARFEYYPA